MTIILVLWDDMKKKPGWLLVKLVVDLDIRQIFIIYNLYKLFVIDL